MHSGLMATSAVTTLLRVLQERFVDADARLTFTDFVVESASGKPFALYLDDDTPDAATMEQMRDALSKQPDALSAYYCLVSGTPTPKDVETFAAVVGTSGVPARLAALRELPSLLGQDYELD